MLNTFEGLSILSFKDIEKWKDFLQRDQWFKKTLKKEEIGRINLVYDQIISIIEDIIKYSTLWLKLLEVHKMIIPFSMVQSLIVKINQEKTSQNSILISDFNDLVSSIIKEEPPGFIFEKIGYNFQEKVREEYLKLAHNNKRFILIDGEDSVENIHFGVLKSVKRKAREKNIEI